MARGLIRELGVRTVHCAPSAFYLLVERELARKDNCLDSLRYAFVGGEPLHVARIAPWATQQGKRCTVLNQYGPAEVTDVALSHALRDYSEYLSAPVPIGTPIHNVEIRILGNDLTELPDGQTGEICISGTGVGAGYLNQSLAEQSRFTTVADGERTLSIYRSGDRGYVSPSGEVVIVGRMDDQVKISGMRIDLGDVRHAVCGNHRVKDAMVLALHAENGEQELVAFVVPAGDRIKGQALRRELFDVLPRNMVPVRFIDIPEFPLTPNGKVDRSALIEFDRNHRARAGD
jgi:non-ribosomal peptide synthetase component F